MQKEKPTKVYKSSNSQKSNKPKKSKSGFFNKIGKSVKSIVNNAMAGSIQHIAILVAAGVLTVAVVGGAVWGVVSLAGSGNNTNVNEIEFDPEADNKYDKNAAVIDTSKYASTILQETADAGQEYIDETLFVGDSNTVRSLMYDVTGTTWENIVGAVGIGIQHVASNSFPCVTFTQPADPVDIVTAIKWIQPKRVVFTFGTNNASWTVESFIEEYKKAIDAAYSVYPYFDVIVNAIPPVHKVRDYPNVTMQQIDAFNAALAQMCEEEGYKFLNSAEVLKDENTGFAKEEYTISDGVHLSKEGFKALFNYIRTHAYETEDRRPELTYCPKRNEIEMPTIIQDPVAIRGGVKVIFTSSDYELGSVDGEVEQYVKYTKTSDAVKAVAKDGAEFTGWTCEYGGISDTDSENITFTAPMLDETITEIRVVANFKKTEPDPTPSPTPGILESITIKVADDATEVKVGEKLELSIITKPENIQLGTVTWTSSDITVATVAVNGSTNKITALKAGKVIIEASTNDGKLKDKIEITVVDSDKALTGITVTASPTTIEVGKTTTVTAIKAPADTTDKTAIEFISSKPSVATVDKTTGVVKGISEGTTEITAKCGVYSAKIIITVQKAAVVATPTPSVTPSATPSVTPSPTPAATPHTHSGGTATCKEKAKCTVCGEEYGELSTTHTPGAEATCGSAQTCTLCGTTLAAATGAHSGGTATCSEQAKCSTCGQSYGDLAGHTPGDGPTCTQAQTCTVCGAETAGAKGHSWGEPVEGVKTCSTCNATESA